MKTTHKVLLNGKWHDAYLEEDVFKTKNGLTFARIDDPAIEQIKRTAAPKKKTAKDIKKEKRENTIKFLEGISQRMREVELHHYSFLHKEDNNSDFFDDPMGADLIEMMVNSCETNADYIDKIINSLKKQQIK